MSVGGLSRSRPTDIEAGKRPYSGQNQRTQRSQVLRFMLTICCLFTLALVLAAPVHAGGMPTGGLVSASTQPGSGGIGIRLLDVPAATQDDPRARSYIVDRIAPGTEIIRRIQVENNTDSAQSVRIYPGAAHIEDGTFVGEDDPSQNELTTWTTAAQEVLELPAGESADVAVSIEVPGDAPEGEQYAAVWAEVRSASGEGNIVHASRVGIRIYLSVGAGNGPPSDFSIDALTASRGSDGTPQVSAAITNTGGRALDISGEVILEDGPGGISTGPSAAQQATTIPPGGAGTVAIIFNSELPDGPWTATARLRSGLVEREAQAQVTFPEAGLSDIPAPVEESTFPWGAVVAASSAAILLLAALLLWQTRRRTRTLASRPRITPPESVRS